MFVETFLESRKSIAGRARPIAFAVVVAFHMIAFGLLAIIPLMTSNGLPKLPAAKIGPAPFLDQIVVRLDAVPGSTRPHRAQPPAGPPATAPAQPAFTAPSLEPSGVQPDNDDSFLQGVFSDNSSPHGYGSGEGTYMGPPGANESGSGAPSAPAAPVAIVDRPVLVSRIDPQYPDHCRRTGIQGTVELTATTDTQGRVIDARIIKPAFPMLNEAALAAVRQWKYKPYMINGRPHAVTFTVTVFFSLNRS